MSVKPTIAESSREGGDEMENELSDERGSKTKAAPGLGPGRLSVIYWLSDGLACEPQSRSQIFNLRRVILTLGSGGSLHMSINGINDKYIDGDIVSPAYCMGIYCQWGSPHQYNKKKNDF